MKRGILIACLIGLVAALGARAADETSTNSPGHHASMRGGMGDLLPTHLLQKLALTTDQKTKYDTLNASFKNDLAALRSSHNSGTESSSSAGSTNSVSSNHKGMRGLRKGYIDQLRPSLTSDQTATLDKALENMRNNRAGQGGSSSSAKPSTPSAGNT
jgi:Spy/CpxP family protein refolding chaperone